VRTVIRTAQFGLGEGVAASLDPTLAVRQGSGVSTATTAGSAGTIPDRDRRALRRWLFASIVAVFLAVAIGGITRLTESGLSITEWKPVSGALPPSSDAAWQVEFEKFLQIPQASTTHAGITLGTFKWIFWWEWFHRNVARTVGLVFAIPWLLFMVQGRIPRRRCACGSPPCPSSRSRRVRSAGTWCRAGSWSAAA
jgi:heme A synthase